ncbi:MAG TPA: DUF29 domain-containing protein [Geminicoccaceae bacterium]|nr:DUF29 domain-containing protein [Geminicoccaceae bacterium]
MIATRIKPTHPPGGGLYEADVVAWAEAQAEALRAGRLDELDLENLAEELAAVGRREARAVGSHLETLVMHLLKWRYDPDHRSRSWEGTIRVARHKIANLLRDNPSLRPRLPALLADAYPAARIRAGVETGLPEETFRRLPLHPRPDHRRVDAGGVAGVWREGMPRLG